MNKRIDYPKTGWYVYGLFIKGIPFYIGKGSGKRVNNHFNKSYLKLNSPKNNVIKKYWDSVSAQIITTHELEYSSFEMETFLINHYGIRSNGGLLTNQTIGGGGSSGIEVTNELRLRRGHSIRKFSESDFIEALTMYYVEGVNQQKAAEFLGISQGQFSRALLGKTETLLPTLNTFKNDHSNLIFGKRRTLNEKRTLALETQEQAVEHSTSYR